VIETIVSSPRRFADLASSTVKAYSTNCKFLFAVCDTKPLVKFCVCTIIELISSTCEGMIRVSDA
jgi:hypothetical protein